ncbi:RagB/SusD family nutrient uptake outer membrane protein [Olivibacter sp. SDN3]|uniref:RagB/SusD family nutrient uptake outer membrane protein n=1 Tax=Olivibacter sp. SDN3 TaxID=2764720 RepID=UPI0016512497|nr:RagB/SusD family nutrient uptake outer membrane protein [Olivibacter sp. SDN3]QNL47840.1 RagB/SusD family nutrient uptake outer membrane protein [Olivibacter sp. SDN3]
MKNLNIYIVCLLSAVWLACAKLEQVPDGINTTDNLFKSESDARAAVNAMYSSLGSPDIYNQFNETIQSQGTDDAEWGFGRNTSNVDKLAMDKFSFTATSDLVYRYWEVHYRNINRANIALKHIPQIDFAEEKRAQYLGEAHFIRGLMYFNLVRLYGAVPIVLEATESLDDLQIARAPIETVYEQIVADFVFAKEHLPLNYETAELGRATKGAAMALLTKVYLTNKGYQQAVNEAKEITDMGQYNLWPSYKEVFEITNENKVESIFEIQYLSLGASGNTNGSSYAGYFKPSALVIPPPPDGFGGFGDNPVTLNHFQAYPEGDLRRDVNVLHVPAAPASIRYPYYVNKYQDPDAFNVDDGGNNYYIARYADVLLMYAEALHELQPGSVEAYDAFNQVRRRAYSLPLSLASDHDLTPGLSVEQFRDSILLERRLEFAFEGHRRFDLLRMGKLKEAMNRQDPTVTVQDWHVLLPVPQDELMVNPLLDQNEGY